jgi:hypothetical protein
MYFVEKADDGFNEVFTRFAQIHWHDSKLLDLHLLKDAENKKYDLRLDLELVVSPNLGSVEWSKESIIFRKCRIIQLDLDLLGVLMCGGDIGSAVFYKSATLFEKDGRNKIHQFDLPQEFNPLESCFGVQIEMIHPGGEIVVFARDFDIVPRYQTQNLI